MNFWWIHDETCLRKGERVAFHYYLARLADGEMIVGVFIVLHADLPFGIVSRYYHRTWPIAKWCMPVWENFRGAFVADDARKHAGIRYREQYRIFVKEA